MFPTVEFVLDKNSNTLTFSPPISQKTVDLGVSGQKFIETDNLLFGCDYNYLALSVYESYGENMVGVVDVNSLSIKFNKISATPFEEAFNSYDELKEILAEQQTKDYWHIENDGILDDESEIESYTQRNVTFSYLSRFCTNLDDTIKLKDFVIETFGD
jgi:hypothetical protein